MNRRKVTLTIICEDRQQEYFARRFLYKMGWNNRKLRIIISPSGRGSGEQWVRDQYAKELERYCSRHVSYAILTIVDGDTKGVMGRIRQFDAQCNDKGIPNRKQNDRVAIIVPTRNIETWIHYLSGDPVDEIQQYPKLKIISDCEPAINQLVKYCTRSGLPADAPNSLKMTCDELQTRIQE